MTQQVRINFLNWRPDQEDTEHDGLVKAENVIHETEGYKEVHLATAGAFATTGGLAASTATIASCVAKPVGSQGDLFCAWVSLTGSPPTATVHVGVNGVTAPAASTGFPLSATHTVLSSAAVTFFDVCELKEKIFFVVRADLNTSGPLAMAGYMDF